MDSPRRGVVSQDAKVPVIGGVRVDSVDTVEGDLLHADLRGRNGRIMSLNPTTCQAPLLYHVHADPERGVLYVEPLIEDTPDVGTPSLVKNFCYVPNCKCALLVQIPDQSCE